MPGTRARSRLCVRSVCDTGGYNTHTHQRALMLDDPPTAGEPRACTRPSVRDVLRMSCAHTSADSQKCTIALARAPTVRCIDRIRFYSKAQHHVRIYFRGYTVYKIPPEQAVGMSTGLFSSCMHPICERHAPSWRCETRTTRR